MRCEPRIKHAIANSKNGVVGKTGKNIPITPNTTAVIPTKLNKNLINICLGSSF